MVVWAEGKNVFVWATLTHAELDAGLRVPPKVVNHGGDIAFAFTAADTATQFGYTVKVFMLCASGHG